MVHKGIPVANTAHRLHLFICFGPDSMEHRRFLCIFRTMVSGLNHLLHFDLNVNDYMTGKIVDEKL